MALKGEIYTVILMREQEQHVTVEIFADGDEPKDVAWEIADYAGWDTVFEHADVVEQVTCAGEV